MGLRYGRQYHLRDLSGQPVGLPRSWAQLLLLDRVEERRECSRGHLKSGMPLLVRVFGVEWGRRLEGWVTSDADGVKLYPYRRRLVERTHPGPSKWREMVVRHGKKGTPTWIWSNQGAACSVPA